MEVISCVNVAQHFLMRSMSSGEMGISMLKLQLMVYMANGWYLGQYNEVLCTENPIATDSGPRYKGLYHHFQIGDMDIVTDLFSEEISTYWEITDNMGIILNLVWEQNESKSVEEMLAIVMKFDDPWHRAWNRYKRMVEIKPQSLWDHYHYFLILTKEGIRY